MKKIILPLLIVVINILNLIPLQSEEGGAGHYLPGSMSSFVDAVATEETFIARYNLLWYDGTIDARRAIPIAGQAAFGVKASSWANGLTLFWRPGSFEIGDNLSFAMSTTIPWVSMDVSANVGPVRRSDSIEGVGDIVLMPFMLNQKLSDDFSINYRLGIYAPTGRYKVGRLANTGKNYWTIEPTVGFMYFGQKNGIEASVFTGADFNTENDDTHYKTGTQIHVDGTLAQHLPLLGGLAGVGVNGYWYEQVTGDSGSGAALGDFKGRTAGFGPVLSYAGKIGNVDVIGELKWLHEFETRDRLQGNYVWFKLLFKF
ncbi:MAG: transporter [Verrucomicrobiota bacterium]